MNCAEVVFFLIVAGTGAGCFFVIRWAVTGNLIYEKSIKARETKMQTDDNILPYKLDPWGNSGRDRRNVNVNLWQPDQNRPAGIASSDIQS